MAFLFDNRNEVWYKLCMKVDTKLAWRLKSVATLGKINLSTRVHSDTKRPGYNRHKENRQWRRNLE